MRLNKILYFIFLACILLGTQACIDELDLPLRIVKPKLVVDGLITNEKRPYSVKLSYTGRYRSSNFLPSSLAINGARVSIKDDRGRTLAFEQDLRELGTYRSTDTNYVGQIGYSYSLEVELPNGEKYKTAMQRLQSVPPILGMSYQYLKQSNANLADGYQVYVDTRDPAGEQNFYRWTALGYSRWESTGAPCDAFSPSICYDFCWVPTYYPQVILYNDVAVNGNTITKVPVFFSPIRALGAHLIEVSQFSLSKEAYGFWNLYEEQRKRVGSIFDPQAAPIEGNLININDPSDLGLGYFTVSAVSKRKFAIPVENQLNTSKELIAKGDCRLVYPFASLERPAGFPADTFK
jgi:hypothetical protein